MDDQLRNVLLHVALLFLIATAFFLAVMRYADPTMFWLRYYGEDVGTIVEGLHACHGDVALPYREIHPEHHYIFQFAKDGLFLAIQNASTPLTKNVVENECRGMTSKETKTGREVASGDGVTGEQWCSSRIVWLGYHGYGQVIAAAPRSLEVVETRLYSPQTINFFKERNVITFNQETETCAVGSLLRKETRLLLTAPPELTAMLEQSQTIKSLEENNRATRTIILTINRGEPSLVVGTTLSQVRCLFEERLKKLYPTIFLSVSAGDAILITIPEPVGASDTAVAQEIILAIEEATR